jgi:hypothetical protein
MTLSFKRSPWQARRAVVVTVLAALYLLNVSYNLQYFYLRGAGDDAGWFAWLAAHAWAWPMRNPALIGGSFLALHMSPIFFAATALLAPLSFWPAAVRFSLFIALWAPLFWLAVFLLLRAFATLGFAPRCAAALLLTFNGLTLSMLGFPHIEILIPALGLLAIGVCARSRTAAGFVAASLIAVPALAVREDAGLHLVLVLTALVLASGAARDRRMTLRLLGLAALCLAGSGLALWVQRHGVPDGGRQLGNVYLGHPLLAQVSATSLARRLTYWATRREYIFLPLLALLVAASRYGAQDRRLLFGAALALPWLSLSLLAASQQAGDLWGYYCFPLVFMLLWPLLLLSQLDAPPPQRLLMVQLVMGGLSTAAFLVVGMLPNVGDGGAHDRAPWAHLWPPSPAAIRLTEAALADRDGWLFDYGTAALAIGALQPRQFRAGLAFDDADIRAARGFIRFIPQPRYLAPRLAALAQAFPVCTPVEGTALEVCTRAAEATPPPGSPPPSPPR